MASLRPCMFCPSTIAFTILNPAPWRAQQQQPRTRASSRQRNAPRSRGMPVAAAMPSPVTSTQVSFTNSHGNKLAGILTLSSSSSSSEEAAGAACQAGDAAPSKCVILCHGYASFKDGFHLPAIAAALAEAGYNSLRCGKLGCASATLAALAGQAAEPQHWTRTAVSDCAQHVWMCWCFVWGALSRDAGGKGKPEDCLPLSPAPLAPHLACCSLLVGTSKPPCLPPHCPPPPLGPKQTGLTSQAMVRAKATSSLRTT